MSELDRDGAKTLDDEDTDSIEEINDDTDDHVLVAEPTDRTTFQADLRAFFQLFNVTKEQLVLKIIGDDKREQSNDLWKSIYRQPPARNYQTVLDIYGHMQKLTTGIAWDDDNAEALDNAIFNAPKVPKGHLEKMCQVTGVAYNSKEKEIDLIQLLATLIQFGVTGAEYIWKKIVAYYELVKISQNLQSNIEDLKTIVSKVNTRRKNRRLLNQHCHVE